MEKKVSDVERYVAKAHAMQTGVKLKLMAELAGAMGERAETSPKHLRVGVNSAMVETGALVKLLMAKGVFTEAEWYKTLADGMEAEVEKYADELGINSTQLG